VHTDSRYARDPWPKSHGPSLEEKLMQSALQTAPASKKGLWTGRVISALAVLFLLFDAVIKLMKAPPVLEAFRRLGYPENVAPGIGILLLACIVVYVIPRTLRSWCDLADRLSWRRSRNPCARPRSLFLAHPLPGLHGRPDLGRALPERSPAARTHSSARL